MIGELRLAHPSDAHRFTVGHRLTFPRRTWLGRLWQRIRARLRLGGYMTVTKVDHARGIIEVE